MGAAETIAAAIEKLEDLRGRSQDNPTPGAWRSRRNVGTDFDVLVDYPETDESLVIAEHVYSADADLVVILHRTIDAQLAILRDALADFTRRENRGDMRLYPLDRQLDLALAILGEVTPDAS